MRVLWFVSSLEKVGGGERFALEAVAALRAKGHEAILVCDRFHPDASFGGRYDLSGTKVLEQKYQPGQGYLRRVLAKFFGLIALWNAVRSSAPQLLVCQSEFDAIKIGIIARFLRCPYRVYVFGQMFQFKTDISRYSTVFRRHLRTIVASRPGYRDTVTLPPPSLPVPVMLVNEAVSRLKYWALRRADRVFVLSSQVKWEVGLLYGRAAVVSRAAFHDSYIEQSAFERAALLRVPLRLLSVCRLVDKKRVDVILRGFLLSGIEGVLHVVGAGPEMERLVEIAGQAVPEGRIIFKGGVDDKELERELAEADCFISMDIGDFDISVVEAMGKGKRAIVARDFDLADFGPALTGVHPVDPDPDSVAAILRTVVTMPAPTSSNIPILRGLTWETLAEAVVQGVPLAR
jgi:glycosyltransferase involved in cell wall biosynthesis